ncbi:hypothetical protein, partial [Proteus mirabilis]|uniref:hypothetical protein n=1 Tax=Proteus mirabilis TaxID=584 RepID=UPI0034E5291B
MIGCFGSAINTLLAFSDYSLIYKEKSPSRSIGDNSLSHFREIFQILKDLAISFRRFVAFTLLFCTTD